MHLNVFSISSLVAAVFIIGLGLIVYIKSSYSKLSILFLVLTIAIGFLNFCQFQIRIAPDFQTAHLWSKAFAVWPLTLIFTLHFALELTQVKYRSVYIYILMYLPGVVISYLHFSTELIALSPVEKYWGWSNNFNDGLFFDIGAVYGVAIWLAILTLLLYYIKQFTGPSKKQILIVFFGFLVNFLISFFTFVLNPIYNLELPELASLADTITFAIVGYGIWRYDIFTLGKNSLSNKLFDTISNYLILVDYKMSILEVNNKLLDRLGYTRSELLGQKLETILAPGLTGSNPLSGYINQSHEFSPRELILVSKKEVSIPMVFSASKIKVTNRSNPGMIYVGTEEEFGLLNQQMLEEKKRHVQFLAEATLDMMKLNHSDEVYAYISNSIYSLLDKKGIVVCSEIVGDSNVNNYQVKSIKGIKNHVSALVKLLGFDVTKLSASSNPIIYRTVENGKLSTLKLDFEELTNGRVSKYIGQKIISLFGIKELQSISVKCGNRVYGVASIFTKNSTPPIFAELIEGFMAIASLVLKRQYAESELTEINLMQSKLFTVIGHDVKSPMGTVIGFTDLILKNPESYSTLKILDFISIIRDSANTGNQILDSLLEWSESIQQNTVINKEFMGLKTGVSNAIDHIHSQAKKKQISIRNSVDDQVSIYADPKMIETVLRNLLSNAVKYSQPKGLVFVDSLTRDGFIYLTVTDNGIGMTKDFVKSLFKLDTWAGVKGTAGEKGSGLGLRICKDFVMKNDGHIEVYSRPNEGSEFKIVFPVPAETPQEEIVG